MSLNNYCDIANHCKLIKSQKDEMINLNNKNLLNENILEKMRAALHEIQTLAEQIIDEEDRPACVYDDDCPMNGGAGFDNHCNEHCPFILSKQIQLKCIEVLEKGE